MKSYKVFNGAFFYGLLSLLLVPIIVSFFGRYRDPSYNDFEAFYLCAQRWAQGLDVYLKNDAFPFKYPPFTLVFFRPLSLFSMDQARNLLGLLNLVACLSVPFAIQFYFHKSFFPKNVEQRKSLLVGTMLALAASLRFIDNEFHSKNINQLTYALILWSLCITKNFKSNLSQLFGHFLFVFGGIFKTTPLLGLASKIQFKKQILWPLLVSLALVFLLPNPLLWKNWFDQIRDTTGYFPISERSIYFQGFFAIGTQYFGLESRSSLSLLASLPFFILLIGRSFSISKVSGTQRDILTLTFILLSLLINPLPWQHIYGFLWVFIPMLYHFSKIPRIKHAIIALSLFLALSPRSIIGKVASNWLEVHQSVAIVALFFILLGFIATRDETKNS